MHTNATIPEPTTPPRSLLAKLLGVIRGDKYMADAYPPAWRDGIEER